LVIAAQ
jgi:hypothetical protein